MSDIKPLYQFLQQISIDTDDVDIDISPKDIVSNLNKFCRELRLINTETAKSLKTKILDLYQGCYLRKKGKWVYKFNRLQLQKTLKANSFWEYDN